MSILTQADYENIISIISRWAFIRSRYIQNSISVSDINHSSLLRRLLSGKDPLKERPPLFMSYPVYSLAEGEVKYPYSVWFNEKDKVIIEQSVWNILERNNDGSMFVRWHLNENAKYLLSPTTEKERNESTFHSEWKIQRIDTPQYLENVYK